MAQAKTHSRLVLASESYKISFRWVAACVQFMLCATAFGQSLNAAALRSTGNVTGLSGGTVTIVAANKDEAAPSFAVVIGGLGLYVAEGKGLAAGGNVSWIAQDCVACASARNAAWDSRGQLWVAASGYGLWRRRAAGVFSEVKLVESNIVQWVSTAPDGSMWLVLGNGVARVDADGNVTRQGIGAEMLGLVRLAMPSTTSGLVYAASAGDVYQLSADSTWQSLKLQRSLTALEQIDGSLYAGTTDGLYRFSGTNWTAVGPSNVSVTAIAKSSSGSIAIATANAGIQALEGGRWVALSDATGRNSRVNSIAADASGGLFAGVSRGLQSVAASAVSRPSPAQTAARSATLNATLPTLQVKAMIVVGSDVFAVVPGQGVVARLAKSSQWTSLDAGLDDDVQLIASNGTSIAVVTESNQIMRYVASHSAVGGWLEAARINVPPSALGIDATGSLWVGDHTGNRAYVLDTAAGKWTNASSGLAQAGRVSAFVGANNGTWYAGTQRAGVFRWDATTRAWITLGREGLPVVATRSGSASSPVNALAFSGGMLYAATDHGVFQRPLSSNATTAWSSLSRGLPESTVTTLTAVDNRLLAGTVRGAYALALTGSANTQLWALLGDTQDDSLAAVAGAGGEWLAATKAKPGKAARVLVGQ
jgi:hypothetical protein